MRFLKKNQTKKKVVLVYCNLVNNNYQQTSIVLFAFVPNKQFGQLINISPHSLTMLVTTNTEFLFTEVWFNDQNSEPLEIEDNVNLTLTWVDILKMRNSTQPKFRKYVKGYAFCHLQENLVINMVKK